MDWVRRTTGDKAFTLAQAQREDLRAYLVPTWDWDLEEGEDFVAQHWQHFFAQALEDWELDRSRWPKQRTPAMFRGWFEVTVCCGVLDLGGHPGQED
ncbi:hypothetical protein FKV23_08720 [Lysobacter alkalisoli]|uniref:Uncharacterized protein n=1 Tax=Marilutibacter alkalisoli TaxID=2591633 RepID=A0A514BS29_9GAMM|nr:hypothetical protein FKV23_08720 [Lysobacter alkalisoli]